MKKILLAGGSGLVGSRMTKQHLYSADYEVGILTRTPRPSHGNVHYYEWDLESQTVDATAFDGVDYIINLTGAGIADARWTTVRKRLIIESRTQSAALIKKGIAQSAHRPSVYLGASGVGYYGSRKGQLLTEESAAGSGFLSESCRAWEDAHHLLADDVDRLLIARIGIVLSLDGGALPKLLMTKKIGIYSYFGDGGMYYSWIHIDDLCRMMLHLITTNRTGVYNAVGPDPLSNKEMMRQMIDHTTLSGVLVPAPAFAIRLAMGEMSAVVLDSTRVSAEKVIDTGFTFDYDRVAKAIESLLSE